MIARRPVIAISVILCAGFALACDSDPEAPGDGLPGADAQELWSYLQDEGYRSDWSLWPGKGELYEWEGQFHPALLTTYVNDEALGAVNTSVMPEGAIIVKENYTTDQELTAITTMYKISGYDPDNGDWFWAEYGPNGQVESSGKVGSCIACHQAAADTDYVFGDSE